MKISEVIQENKEDLAQLILIKFSTSLVNLTQYFHKAIAYYAANNNEQTKVRLMYTLRKFQNEIEVILFDRMWQDNEIDVDAEATFNEFVTLNNEIEDYIETL